MGLMQLMPKTAAARGVKDPFDPKQNVQAGIAELGDLYKKYGNWREALIAYNWGQGNYDKAKASGRSIPSETRTYVAKVMRQAGLA